MYPSQDQLLRGVRIISSRWDELESDSRGEGNGGPGCAGRCSSLSLLDELVLLANDAGCQGKPDDGVREGFENKLVNRG